MNRFRIVLLPALLAALGGAAGCTTGGAGVDAMSLAPADAVSFPADPVLPEMVAALPDANPAFDGSAVYSDEFAARSLAADVEQSATISAAYAGGTVTGPLAAQQPADEVMALGGRPLAMRPTAVPPPEGRLGPGGEIEARSPELDHLIRSYANHYEVPESLVRRVAKRESTFNPGARNGAYWGLMQISHATARGMGYRGEPTGLLDAETNLKYAVRYLRGAYIVANGDEGLADRLYQRGYYYDAKRAGLLEATGLGADRKRGRY